MTELQGGQGALGSLGAAPEPLSILLQLTCVGVGDVCNKGKVRSPGARGLLSAHPRFPCSDHQPPPLPRLAQNLVVAVSAEGWFHLCDLTPAKSLDGSGHHETLGGEEQRPVFKQHIPANTKVMLISDIGGHGCVCRQLGSRSWGSRAGVKGAGGSSVFVWAVVMRLTPSYCAPVINQASSWVLGLQ